MIIKATKKQKTINKDLLFTKGYKSGLKVTYLCDNCNTKKTVSIASLVKHNHIEKQYCLS